MGDSITISVGALFSGKVLTNDTDYRSIGIKCFGGLKCHACVPRADFTEKMETHRPDPEAKSNVEISWGECYGEGGRRKP